jgi:hypothetical protein
MREVRFTDLISQSLRKIFSFTVVRARCAPHFFYRKNPGMALLRNNRTGEEGYIRRDHLIIV